MDNIKFMQYLIDKHKDRKKIVTFCDIPVEELGEDELKAIIYEMAEWYANGCLRSKSIIQAGIDEGTFPND